MHIFKKNRFDSWYHTGELPWDTGLPCEHLKSFVDSKKHKINSALELGCGTGTNAIYLAQSGFQVFACDFSPQAINLAKEKSSDPKITYEVMDVLSFREDLVDRFDFVFDRGCFHSIGFFRKRKFVKHIHKYMKKDGIWLLLCGSKDETGDFKIGPPRLSIKDISKAVEPYFCVKDVKAIKFTSGGKQAWRWILSPR
jgi:cyclopropane fatty-acyl-phospholipid synthase-like methyltransferase